jgi:hypothetical protein
MPLADQFWGDRYGHLKDPFGFTWSIATRKENPTPEEIQKRQAAAFGGRVSDPDVLSNRRVRVEESKT